METGESAGRYDNQETVEAFKPDVTPTPEVKVDQKPAEAPTGDEVETDEAKQSKKRNGYKEKLERTKAELAEARAQLEASKPKEDTKAEPKVEDFETYDAYYKASAKYEATQEFARLKAEDANKSTESELRKQAEAKRDSFNAKAEVFIKHTPDFEEVIEESGMADIPQLGMVLLESDLGPELAYHLAKNPEDLEQLKGMTYTQKAKFIGKLEARFEKTEPKGDIKPKEVKVSKAPPPITPLGKTATTASYDPFESKGKDDHDDYMKWRAGQKR